MAVWTSRNTRPKWARPKINFQSIVFFRRASLLNDLFITLRSKRESPKRSCSGLACRFILKLAGLLRRRLVNILNLELGQTVNSLRNQTTKKTTRCCEVIQKLVNSNTITEYFRGLPKASTPRLSVALFGGIDGVSGNKWQLLSDSIEYGDIGVASRQEVKLVASWIERIKITPVYVYERLYLSFATQISKRVTPCNLLKL